MPPVQLFVRACAGYEILTKPARGLFVPPGVWSEGQINSCANNFVGFGDLVQMSRLAARVHHKQAPVFEPEIRWFAISRFDLEFA
ncbi:MAG: hypothetical protein ACYTX0_62195, partial [Nostoc sp.]